MTNRLMNVLANCVSLVVVMGGLASLMYACSGPQPLDMAIQPGDEEVYLGAIAVEGQSPREAFLQAKAKASGKTLEQVKVEDVALSTTKNPFSAKHDPEAVSSGAVIYKYNCMSCHGADAKGNGPEMTQSSPEMNFHRFATRFAVTLHGGAPSKWFRIIDEGITSEKGVDAEGVPLVMKPFHDTLAREQIWQVVTYLQSVE